MTVLVPFCFALLGHITQNTPIQGSPCIGKHTAKGRGCSKGSTAGVQFCSTNKSLQNVNYCRAPLLCSTRPSSKDPENVNFSGGPFGLPSPCRQARRDKTKYIAVPLLPCTPRFAPQNHKSFEFLAKAKRRVKGLGHSYGSTTAVPFCTAQKKNQTR